MTRFILALLLLGLTVFAADDIDAKIEETSDALKHFDRNYASVNAKMAATAESILRKKRTVLAQRKQIDALESELQSKGETLSASKEELERLNKTLESIEANQQQLRRDLAELMARIVSLAVIHDDANTLSPDAVIGEAVFASLGKEAGRQIRKLSSDYAENQKNLQAITGQTTRLKTEISAIESQKRRLVQEKQSNEKALSDLGTKKERYKKQLEKLLSQKQTLKQTLARLHIIQESETQKARDEEENRRNEALLASKPLPEVKSVGSSYHKARTRRYRGEKTIAPLEEYTVLKRYGTYTDPIYRIKIFNESVSLKPKYPDAKVKAVFNGKVILAQETPMLENVVIIEHADGLHTIYAHLDQIAPTVRKGKRLKKGSVIGRVNDELMFEITQKNDHIDPLQVIQ